MKNRFSALGLCILCLCFVSASSAQTLNPGTEIQVQLLTRLDTGSTQAGQEFQATLAQPLTAGRTVWPKGTDVKGKVIEVVSSGRLQRPASITLQLTQIGNSPVETEPETIDGKSHAGRNVGLIGGGAAMGAILGGIAGGGRGAAIGAAIGGGAGVATAAATGKQEIVLAPETPVNFVTPGGAPPAPPQPVEQSMATPPPPQPVSEPVVNGDPYGDRDHDEYRDRDADYRERRGDDWDRSRIFFSERDRDVIREYFRSRDDGRGLPPGLERRNDLPPGLERQLRRDGTLPPGLQRRVYPFPERLDRRLGLLPPRYSRVVLSGRAMILRDDGLIVDMMFVN
jgi:hypothetical protein